MKNPSDRRHQKPDWRYVLLWTFVVEAVTIAMRFGLGLQSSRDTASTIGRLTLGLRIHHGYCGVVVLIITALLMERFPNQARIGLIVGFTLLLSDVVHHFGVLAFWYGDPQFHLWYGAS